jgi:cytochrome P450
MIIVAEMIGIPPEDHQRFLGWSHDIIGIGKDPRRGTASAQAMDRYLAPIVRARHLQPQDDVISHLATTTLHGRGLSEAEVAGFLRVLIPAAADPPAQMLGSLLVALLGERERFERVAADRALVPWAVAEALRWEAPIVYVVRQATRPTVIAGTPVAAGTDLCLVVGSANRDAALHDGGERFDLDRRVEEHLSFGYGRHYCLGSHLARLIGRVGLEVLLDRLPRLRLDPDAPPPAIVGFAFRRPPALAVRFD